MFITHVFRFICIQMGLLGILSSLHRLDTVSYIVPLLQSLTHHHPVHSLPLHSAPHPQGIKTSPSVNFSLFSSLFFFFFFSSSSFSFSLFSPFHLASLRLAHFPPHPNTFIHTHKKNTPTPCPSTHPHPFQVFCRSRTTRSKPATYFQARPTFQTKCRKPSSPRSSPASPISRQPSSCSPTR